jgi:hypothetical protein
MSQRPRRDAMLAVVIVLILPEVVDGMADRQR